MSTTRRKSTGTAPKLHVVGDSEAHPDPEVVSADHSAVDRAEKVVDHWRESVAVWSSNVSHTVQRTSSRVKEELEDFWAEAKSLSRSRK